MMENNLEKLLESGNYTTTEIRSRFFMEFVKSLNDDELVDLFITVLVGCAVRMTGEDYKTASNEVIRHAGLRAVDLIKSHIERMGSD